MDAVDESSAAQFQIVHNDSSNGFWNTGQLGAKGFVVEEPVNSEEQTATDSIKRYTDKYLTRKQIGRTVADFDFQKAFLPKELYKAAGITIDNDEWSKKQNKPETRRVEDLDRYSREKSEDAEKADKNGNEENPADHEDDDDDNGEGDEEDEFEELEDDDYNAEKYFDDGDDYGDGDEGDGEAAY